MDNWIYSTGYKNTARYLLGEKGDNPLVCLGINPSTAEPNNLDNTLKRVKCQAVALGYDSWLMINLYPQRATNPQDLHKTIDENLHIANLNSIKAALNNYSQDIWAAWGTLIEIRTYLWDCLADIYSSIGDQASWYTIGKKSQKGHPHHPLYLKNGLTLERFDIELYLNKYVSKMFYPQGTLIPPSGE